MNALIDQIRAKPGELPAIYTNACQILARCAKVDECKNWADRAAALASYARQADDKTLENYAMRIRARAVRRAGELLNEYDGKGRNQHSKGSRTGPTTQRKAAEEAGMSKDQQVQAVRVAKVPADQFDAAIEADKPATVTKLADAGTAHKPVERPPGFAEATQFMGSIARMAEFCAANQPAVIAKALMPHEVKDVRDRTIAVFLWLSKFTKEVS